LARTVCFPAVHRYDELSESIREHLDEKIEDMIDHGMTREEAERKGPSRVLAT